MKTETLTVETTADLQQIASRYSALADAGEPAILEVRLGPGPYEGASLELEDFMTTGAVAVRLKGAEAAPAVFSRSRLQVMARRLELEHVVFVDARSALPVLSATVKEGVRLHRVAFVDDATSGNAGPRGGKGRPAPSLVQITAGYRTPDQDLELSEVWFAGNQQTGHLAMCTIGSDRRGGSFSTVRGEGLAVVGNQAQKGFVFGHGVKDVSLSNVLLVDPVHTAEGSAVTFTAGEGLVPRLENARGVVEHWSTLSGGAELGLSGAALHVRSPEDTAPSWAPLSSSTRTWDIETLRTRARQAAAVSE